MRRIPLQTLPTFRAVARLSSLRAAAEQLHLTHSAISQQIRLLEQQLGFDLFDRPGKRVVLNAAGAAFLSAVESALSLVDEGVRSATAAHTGVGQVQRLRLTALPSFTQHWLLPRMPRWQALHPDMTLELHTTLQVVDIKREGFHVALRQGKGPWRGLEGTCLIDSPLIVVAAPALARGLPDFSPAVLAQQALLGTSARWEHWFAEAGHPCRVTPVATFNDMGLLLQATEQGMGVALARKLLAADALRAGRLVQLSAQTAQSDGADFYWLLHAPEHRDWPPVVALRAWLQAELQSSVLALEALPTAASAASPLMPAPPAP